MRGFIVQGFCLFVITIGFIHITDKFRKLEYVKGCDVIGKGETMKSRIRNGILWARLPAIKATLVPCMTRGIEAVGHLVGVCQTAACRTAA